MSESERLELEVYHRDARVSAAVTALESARAGRNLPRLRIAIRDLRAAARSRARAYRELMSFLKHGKRS